jgi:hypothetical protein
MFIFKDLLMRQLTPAMLSEQVKALSLSMKSIMALLPVAIATTLVDSNY